jgi:multidrug efflux pump subunit AcrA (membrane-fusion protein)
MIKKILEYKYWLGAAVVMLLLGGWYFSRGSSANQGTETTQVKRDTVVQEVSVTGKVKAAEEVALAFQRAGKINNIYVTEGDQVKTGDVLARLDAHTAQQAVLDAQTSLESAQIALDRLTFQHGQQIRGDTLNKNYEEGLSKLTTIYNDFATTLNSLNHIFFDTDLSGNPQENNIQYYAKYNGAFAGVPPHLADLYQQAKAMYLKSLMSYQAAQRGAGEDRAKAVADGYALVVKTAELIKTGRDVVRSLEDILSNGSVVHTKQATIDKHISDLNSYATTMDGNLNDLLTIKNAIESERDVTDTYDLDKSSQEVAVRQRENALRDAEATLAEYSIRSPLDGIVTKQDGETGEIVASNDKIVSLISNANFQIEANIAEVDIAKVALGNEADVTLDAYGSSQIFKVKIVKIDPAATVVDGVPTYLTTFEFVENDPRLKAGMTANVDIRTAAHENVLSIPQRALISKDGKTYVEMPAGNTRREVEITTGLKGSFGTVEIISGLNENDTVIANP